MKRNVIISAVILAVLLGLIGKGLIAQDKKGDSKPVISPMERYLPEEVLLYVKIKNASSLPEYFKKSPLYKMWEEKELQKTAGEQIEQMKKSIDEAFKEFEKETKVNVEDLLGTLKGEITFTLVDFDPKSMDGPGPPKLDFVISIDTLDKKADFVKYLDMLMKSATEASGENGPKPSKDMYKSQEIQRFGDKNVMLNATWLGSKWVFSFDKTTLHGIIDRYFSEGVDVKCLKNSEDFNKIYGKCGGGGEEIFVYGTTSGFLGRIKDVMPPELGKLYADMGLLDTFKMGYGAFIEADGTAREKSYAMVSKDHKLMSLPGKPELDTGLLFPVDNVIFWLSESCDMNSQFNYLMNMLESGMRQGGGDLSESLTNLEKDFLGFNVEEELVKSLGSKVNFFIMLPEGGGAFPELALTVEVKKEDLLKGAIEKFADKMGEDMKSTDYMGTRMYYFSIDKFAGEDNELPYWPAFAVAKNRFMAASSPQVVKRMIGNLETPVEATGDLKKILGELPKTAYQFAYADCKKGFGYVYNTLIPYMHKKQEGEMPEFLDPGKLPPVELFLKHLSHVYMYGAKDESGLYGEVVSPKGPVSFSIIAAAIGFAVVFPNAIGPDGQIKGLGESRRAAGEAYTVSVLRTLSSAQEMFNVEYGNYAGGLRALADKGYIDSKLATGVQNGYMFELKASGPNKWHCTARPLVPGKGKFYYIDQTGVIRFSKTADIGPKSKPLGQ